MGAADHLEGRCHCGAVHVVLELSRRAEEIELRACQCSFCRRHGARALADIEGRALITVRKDSDLNRYRFGKRTADFLICAGCGVYIAAVTDGKVATVNVAGLDIPAFRERGAMAVDYSGESTDERLERRRARWMPVEIRIGATLAAREKEACG